MWSHPHDQYSQKTTTKKNDNLNTTTTNNKLRSRTASKPKRPTRPTRSLSPKDATTTNEAPTDKESSGKYTYRGRGRSNEKKDTKPNPWAHPHDQYAVRKPKNRTSSTETENRKSSKDHSLKRNTKSPKSGRPVRSIRFDHDNNNNNNPDQEDGDNDPEEKSNRPLPTEAPRHKISRRPKKKPTYVNAANIHAQQFRSGYRAKPLPPDPRRRTNLQKIENGKNQFNNIIKQAAAMEGLDKSDVRVQRMIQRLGEQMSDISGFDRFLQNKDEELQRMVTKQEKRKKQLNQIHKKMQIHEQQVSINTKLPNENDVEQAQQIRKGSVKDLTARFEKKSNSVASQATHSRRERLKRNQKAHALRLPNTKAHRRRVSSQFSVAAISAVLSQNSNQSSIHPHNSPLENLSMNKFPDTSKLFDKHHTLTVDNGDISNIDVHGVHGVHGVHTPNQLDPEYGVGRHSRNSRASISHSGASIIIKNQNSDNHLGINSVILGVETPGNDGMGDDESVHSHVTASVAGTFNGDPLGLLLSILGREPQERTDEEIDILVSFFENFQIMTEDVDTWSGKATFRSFIQQTRYKHIPQSKFIFREHDEGDEFYFVLRGNVSVLVDDASIVHTSKRNIHSTTSPKQEIHTVLENHVFGEIAMFNQGKRSATCVAKTDVHLAYWDRATYDEFIRPMKELRHKAQKILRDKQGNMLSEDQLIEKAAMFLDDAMHGRELKMHRNGPWPRRIHKLINHKYFNYCLVMVSMLWLALIFIEPPSYRDSIIDEKSRYFYRIMPLIAFEWFVFLIFLGECSLRFYSFGSSWFFTIDLHVMRVILLIIFAADLIITCIYQGNSFRFSRVVRPIFPILFIRDLRRQYYIVLACVPYIIELIILWLIIGAIFARIAYHIFYHSEGHLQDGSTRQSVYMQNQFNLGEYPYDDKMYDYCQAAINDDTMKNCDQFFDDFVWNSFDTFFKSLIALFALLTTENFPEAWWPTWLSNHGKPYWTFFLIYALIAIFFLLNLFSAAVYDAYQHIISKLDVIDEKRETQALKVAWICLDTGDAGAIGPTKFENLMYRLKPEYTEFEIGVTFKLLDPDNNRLIDAEEFSVMMINVLYLSISRKTRSKEDELKLYLQKLAGSCPFGYEILRLFTSQTWRYIMLLIQSIDICALLSYHQYPEEMNVVDFICILLILLALVLDVIFKHMSQLKTYFKSSRNRLYFGLTMIQTIGTFIGIVNDREWVSALRFFGILRILIVAVLALEKVKFLRTSLTRTLTQTVIFMIPVFGRIVIHICVVLLYVYTIIGIEIFVDPDESTWGQNRCDAPQQLLQNPYALFCDAAMTVITLTQILTTNNWHIIMYKAIEITDNWYMALYFITFFFLGPILVVSLLLAMFFNMFFGVSMQSEHELSAFFHETDQEAKNLQEHMELQEIKDQMDADLELRGDIPLPTEVGISELPNGAKILTIRRPKIRNSKINQYDNINNDDDDDNDVQAIPLQALQEVNDENKSENDDDETKAQEMELVHIPLQTVTRQIWDHVPGEEWLDPLTNNTYKSTFTGKEATQYLLDAGFAPDGEEAVDYLALIMDEIGAFMRVDSGKEPEFENEIDAHYQWIIVPDDEELNAVQRQIDDMDEYDDEVAFEDIMIGFRHSYGGYHRLLKQYRQAGIDPTQEAARVTAAKHITAATPLSEQQSDKDVNENNNNNNNDHERDKSTSPDLTEKLGEIPQHIKNQSQKLKDGFFLSLKNKDSNNKPNGGNGNDDDQKSPKLPIIDDTKNDNKNDKKKENDDNNMAESDEDFDDNGTVIVLGYSKDSNNNNNNDDNLHNASTANNDNNNSPINTKSPSNGFQINKLPTLTKIDSNSSDQGKKKKNEPLSTKSKGYSTKDLFSSSTTTTKLKRGNKGSLELMTAAKHYVPSKMRKTVSTGDDSTPDLFRRQTMPHKPTEDTVPALPKTKSVHQKMIKSGGLKRSASSKNILLRHLDQKGPKATKSIF